MGFFSWNCRGCGKSVRSRFANAGRGNWMTRVVAATESGVVVAGEYDGYGRIDDDGKHDSGGDDFELGEVGPFSIWHAACAPSTPVFDGQSTDAKDQGYFCSEVLTLFPPGHDREEVRRVHTDEVAGILAEIRPQLEALNLSEHWALRVVASTAEHMAKKNRQPDAVKADP